MTHIVPLLTFATIGVVFILCVVAFRSVMLPLRLLATIALTIGSVFGAANLVFRYVFRMDGLYWLVYPVGTPILIGIVIDYDVLLVSRIFEYRAAHGFATRAAVLRGLRRTGSTITLAGIIMMLAFGASPLLPSACAGRRPRLRASRLLTHHCAPPSAAAFNARARALQERCFSRSPPSSTSLAFCSSSLAASIPSSCGPLSFLRSCLLPPTQTGGPGGARCAQCAPRARKTPASRTATPTAKRTVERVAPRRSRAARAARGAVRVLLRIADRDLQARQESS